MKTIELGKNVISREGPCYVIAEIGHNHQGNLETACKMIEMAASCGVQAVKFQKRDNKTLYTRALYNSPYENENSYGSTYGEHREFLEFDKESYKVLKKCAEQNNVEFMATAFDFNSVDFLEDIEVRSYKVASGDLTNTPLLEYIAKLGKPMFVSTGAATIEEIKLAYDAIFKYNDKLCILHCTASYPAEYHELNLRFIDTLIKEFPEAIIGYSGHDNGILAAVIAYMLGATVVEKHFTLNRSWKGTDHKFSLEPEGLRKQVRDLRRTSISLGDGKKTLYDSEKGARTKMGKGVYSARALPKGTILSLGDICFKSPGNGFPPYRYTELIGKVLNVDVDGETPLNLEYVD